MTIGTAFRRKTLDKTNKHENPFCLLCYRLDLFNITIHYLKAASCIKHIKK